MKATGIVRRVDDLGRIVIPKEIRRNLGLREGEAMEIFLEDNCVCFKSIAPQKKILQSDAKSMFQIEEFILKQLVLLMVQLLYFLQMAAPRS